MKIKHFTAVSLILIGLAMISFTAKDGVTLRLKPQQGKTYTITTKASMMMLMEVQGQTMNQQQSLETRQSFTAENVTDNESLIETQIEAMKMTISQMGMKLEYDSEHPEKTSPMLAGQTAEMDKVIKKMETVKYDALGNIIDSINLEMSQLGAAIIQLPEEEISVGTTWVFDRTQGMGTIEINAKMTYTVTAISKKSVDVSVSGTVEGLDETNGTYEGTASINPQTGLVMNSSIKSNISMTLKEQGLTIPMTVVGNTTVEVK